MPVKKQKTKSRRFKALGSTEATQAVEELISGVEHWPSLVTLLAGHYQLPDLSSKKGLKECYRNIDTISISLRYAFGSKSCYECKCKINYINMTFVEKPLMRPPTFV